MIRSHVNIGLIRFGVVGSGFMQLLKEQRQEIEARIGAPVRVLWVCRRRKKKSPLIPRSTQLTNDWRKVVSDPRVDCVVELIGGTNPARQIVKTALQKGKHVITANKALLSKHWNEVFDLARDRSRLVYFEAAVGGGVPIVQALNEGLAGNRIRKIVGILNGTTNYILTRMIEADMDFDDALDEAKKAGFAEANPKFDIQGVDAAQKISILGSLAIGRWVPPSKVYCEGINKLQALDIRLIKKELESTIKLLGIAEKSKKGWVFRVHPTLIHETHPFENVRNEYNAVSVFGNATDEVMLYGKGAGRLPTASAVVSDLIFLARQVCNGTAGQLPYVHHKKGGVAKLASIQDARCRYYLRVTSSDKSGVLSSITGILSRHGVSIASIHQDVFDDLRDKRGLPIVFVTHENLESNVLAAVRAIDRLRSTQAKTVLLRME